MTLSASLSRALARPLVVSISGELPNPELMVNGNFADGSTGWTLLETNTATFVEDNNAITRVAGQWVIEQNVATDVGATYRVVANVLGNGVQKTTCAAFHNNGITLIHNEIGPATGEAELTYDFVATSTNTKMRFGVNGGSGTTTARNISVKKA